MWHLPKWCCVSPPPRIDSIESSLDQLAEHPEVEVRRERASHIDRVDGTLDGHAAGLKNDDGIM